MRDNHSTPRTNAGYLVALRMTPRVCLNWHSLYQFTLLRPRLASSLCQTAPCTALPPILGVRVSRATSLACLASHRLVPLTHVVPRARNGLAIRTPIQVRSVGNFTHARARLLAMMVLREGRSSSKLAVGTVKTPRPARSPE